MKHVALILILLLSIVGDFNSTSGQREDQYPVITPENADKVEELAILGFGFIDDAAWSPDGNQVAVASSVGILLYDAEHFDMAPFERLPVPDLLTSSVAYSPDGRLLASLSHDLWGRAKSVTVRLWDTGTLRLITEWVADFVGLDSQLEFSPDGRILMLYDDYDPARVPALLWNINNQTRIQQSDSREYDDVIAEWYPPLDLAALDWPDLTSQRLVTVSRDHRWLAASDDKSVIRIWDLVQREHFTVGLMETASGLVFSPNGSFLKVDRGLTRELLDTATGEELFWYSKMVEFSPDEQKVLVVGPGGKSLILWDRTTRTSHDVLGNSNSNSGAIGNFAWDVAFSPDSTRLAVCRNEAVEVWDTNTRTRFTSLKRLDFNFAYGVTFSPDGSLLVVFGWNGAWFYDTATFEEIARLEVDEVRGITFSPDGDWLAAQLITHEGDENSSLLTLWEVEVFLKRVQNRPGMETARLDYLYGSNYPTDPVAFSPDGALLATAAVVSADVVLVWDVEKVLNAPQLKVESLQQLPEAVIGYLLPQNDMIWQVVFSPDGHSLAIDNTIYDTTTWAVRFELVGHAGTVTSVAFSPDGNLITTSSGSTEGWFFNNPGEPDDTIRLWDGNTGKQLAVLQGHTEGIWQVVVSPDGRLLASGSGATIAEDVSLDGTVRLWGVD